MIVSETALDWWQRCEANHRSSHGRNRKRKRRQMIETPTDPITAAVQFLQGSTGIAYVDAAWQQSPEAILVLEGSVAKTWTLRSLAARWVVSTRRSRFHDHRIPSIGEEETPPPPPPPPASISSVSSSLPPQVFILDSNHDFATANAPSMATVVRSILWKHQTSAFSSSSSSSTLQRRQVEQDLQGWLERIHICSTDDDASGWIAILEVLRYKLSRAPFQMQQHYLEQSNSPPPPPPAAAAKSTTFRMEGQSSSHSRNPSFFSFNNNNTNNNNDNDNTTAIPTLILWDACPAATMTATGKEVLQQLLRLLEACPHVSLVVTTPTTAPLGTSWSSSNSTNNRSTSWMQTLTGTTTTRGRANAGSNAGGLSRRQLQRIQLERRHGKDCVATVLAQSFPFSLSLLGGILS